MEKAPFTFIIKASRNTAGVFSAVLAVFLALFFYLLRIGFGFDILFLIKILSLAFYILLLPEFTHRLVLRYWLNLKDSWVLSNGMITLVGLFSLVLAGFIQNFLPFNCIYFFSTMGCIFFAVAIWDFYQKNSKSGSFFLAFVILLFSLFCIGMLFAYETADYHDPLAIEKAVGIQGIPMHNDSMLFISIMNMINTYGIPSAGLDGLPYFHYSVGAHLIFSMIFRMIHANPVISYQVILYFIFIPLLFNMLLLLIFDIQKLSFRRQVSNNETDNFLPISFWVTIIIYFFGFFPLAARWKIVGDDYEFFFNTSFLVSLIFIFATISIVISFIRTLDADLNNYTNKPGNLILLLAVIPLILGAITYTKPTAGFLVGGLYGYMVIRCKLYRHVYFGLSVLMSFVLMALLYRLTIPPNSIGIMQSGPGIKFDLFGFHFFDIFQIKYLAFIHLFFWSIVFIVLRIKNVVSLQLLKKQFSKMELFDVEIVLISMILCLIPSAIFKWPSAADFYFLCQQRWIGAGFLLALLVKQSSSNAGFLLNSIRSIKPIRLLAAVLLIPILMTSLHNSVYYFISAVKKNIDSRMEIIKLGSNPDIIKKEIGGKKYSSFGAVNFFIHYPYVVLKENPKYGIIVALMAISQKPINERRKSFLYIQPASEFWRLYEGPVAYVTPLVATALSGMALIDGAHYEQMEKCVYGWSWYYTLNHQTQLSDEELCDRSRKRKKDIERVLILEGNKSASVRTLICGKNIKGN